MKPMIGKSIYQSMTIDSLLVNWHRLASANRWPIDNHTEVVATHRLSSIGVKKLGIPRSSMYVYALAVRANVWDDLNLFTGLFMLQFNIQFERQIITNVSVLRWFLIFFRLYFRFARWNIPAGRAKRKIGPDTILLRNVCRPLFWLIDIQQNGQSKFVLLARSSVCKFPICVCNGIRKKSSNVGKNKKITGYDKSWH